VGKSIAQHSSLRTADGRERCSLALLLDLLILDNFSKCWVVFVQFKFLFDTLFIAIVVAHVLGFRTLKFYEVVLGHGRSIAHLGSYFKYRFRLSD